MRNLTPEEIVGQILIARDRLGDYPGKGAEEGMAAPSTGRLVSNIVMMGMGEPLYNFDHVKAALLIAADGDGIGLSRRRITLSTSGVVPMIPRAGERDRRDAGDLAPRGARRTARRAGAAQQEIPDRRAARRLPRLSGLSNARRITFEYVMLKGVNDSLAEARELVRLLAGIPAKINLIPFNPWPGTDYECSDWEQIERFADIVNRAGYASPIRTPRGRDILAACGQLKSESERHAHPRAHGARGDDRRCSGNAPAAIGQGFR